MTILCIILFLGNIISIAFFNFSGISVTKEISATTRMVLDSIRTFVIWMVTLGIGWQAFQWMQIIGFLLLLCGMCLYNEVIIVPLIRFIKQRWQGHKEMEVAPTVDDEREPLMTNGPGKK